MAKASSTNETYTLELNKEEAQFLRDVLGSGIDITELGARERESRCYLVSDILEALGSIGFTLDDCKHDLSGRVYFLMQSQILKRSKETITNTEVVVKN